MATEKSPEIKKLSPGDLELLVTNLETDPAWHEGLDFPTARRGGVDMPKLEPRGGDAGPVASAASIRAAFIKAGRISEK